MSEPSGSGPAAGRSGSGGPPLALAAAAVAGVALMFLAIGVTLLGGTGGPGGPGAPAASPTAPTSGTAARQTATLAQAALGNARIQVTEPQAAFRPPESPTLFSAPRLILQAVLPDDPDDGQFVIYEFRSSADAAAAGREFADYIGSGVGRVQFPNDARFVLRRVGATLLFFSWSPANATDERTADVADALATVGEPITIPS